MSYRFIGVPDKIGKTEKAKICHLTVIPFKTLINSSTEAALASKHTDTTEISFICRVKSNPQTRGNIYTATPHTLLIRE